TRARRHYLRLREAAILIQRQSRANQIARQERAQFERIRKANITLQRWYRRKRNLDIVGQHVNRFVERRRQAATVIQRHWRGRQTRMTAYKQHPTLLNCVQRIYEVTSAQYPTIGVKTDQLVKRLDRRWTSQQSLWAGGQTGDQLVGEL